jgi:phospholipid/cholesterol/gamma-HCH transport system permease protein
MSGTPPTLTPSAATGPVRRGVEALGAWLGRRLAALRRPVLYVGGLGRLYLTAAYRLALAVTGGANRVSGSSLVQQCIRVGVKSVPIVIIVQTFVGIILALSLAAPLDDYGARERIADVIVLAMFREMGALFSAVILSGFAGASIAAELGAMVEGEEIKALRAHALDPIRFLVVPRIFATAVMMIGLTILADMVGVLGGFLTSVFILDLNPANYVELTRQAVTLSDYFTGLIKGVVFGALIAGLACYEGLNVKGGAEGVGRATTTTVVKSIVALIATDCVFAIVYFRLGLW